MKKGSKVWDSTYKKKYDKIIVEKGYPPVEVLGVGDVFCLKCLILRRY